MSDGASRAQIVFFLDVDNTLLDNDRLKTDVAAAVVRLIGPERSQRFWEVYEQVRAEEDFVDFPQTIERMSRMYDDPGMGEELRRMLWNWPFADYLYPGAMDTIAYLQTLGTVVILSDGDPVFQPLKIERSGLEAAVDGQVLIYVHKEDELKDVFSRYPAGHYVAVDDKPRIISALERDCPDTFTTVLVLQGKYARQAEADPTPDYTIQRIGDLRTFTRANFLAPSHAGAARA
jgi:phosphoglycolate phosphatase-like HAD superfamily hydrolase